MVVIFRKCKRFVTFIVNMIWVSVGWLEKEIEENQEIHGGCVAREYAVMLM